MLKNLLPLISCLASITAAQAVPITGKVVGPDDKPVAGAEIVVIRDYDVDKPIALSTDQAGVFKADLEPVETGTPNFGVATAYAPPLSFGKTLLKQDGNVIKLERAAPVQGIVQDKAGKPVADAVVKLQYVTFLTTQEASSNYMDVAPPLSREFTVKSGADGHWAIAGVPYAALAMVMLDDPRFARTETQVKPGVEAAARLTALPGANISGRVVHEDGTPATGIKVHTYGRHTSAEAVTIADGTYTLTSLAAEVYTVLAYDPTAKLVTPPLLGVQAKVGETIKIADQVLTAGALLTGQVTDQADGTPLRGMSVVASVRQPDGGEIPASGAWRPTITDKDGRFRLRVVPGKVNVGVWWSEGKYLPQTKAVEIEIHKGETKAVPIQLVKGLSVSGTATNTDGKPVANATFSLTPHPVAVADEVGTHTYMGPITTKADATGQWAVDGLTPGQWDIKGTSDWEVVSPQQIVVPLTAAVKVMMRPIQWQTLKGRVTTKGHAPVAGAMVKALIEIPNSEYAPGNNAKETLTDERGQFVIEKLRPDSTVSLSTKMPGYKYVAGGKVTRQEAGFTAQDLILMPLTEKLEGRVVDTMGQPVAGAQIMSPDGDLKAPATSDGGGRWTLTGLPAGEVMVIAGLKERTGEAREVNNHRLLNLTIAPLKPLPAHNIQRAYEVLDDLWATTEDDKYYRSHIPATLATVAPDLALKLATKPDGSVASEVLARVIINYARADPAHAAQWAPSKLNQIQNADEANYTRLSFALAIATVKPDLAGDFYQQGKLYFNAQLAKNAHDPQPLLGRPMMLVPLARKLGLEVEANQFVQAAITVAQATKERKWMLAPLAAIEYDAKAKMIDELDAVRRPEMLSNAVRESAKYDLKLARRWLDKLMEAEKKSGSGPQFTGTATQSLVTALGQTDPAGALALARAAPVDPNKPLTLAIAAQCQTKEIALPTLHEAADMVLGESSSTLATISRIAAQAYELDPKFGLELFATARERWESAQAQNEAQDRYGYEEGGAALAFYYSRVDPAASHLMLEAEFARLLQQTKSDPTNTWQLHREMQSTALAMAALDVERALELSSMIPNANINQGDLNQLEAQRGIAQYLLLSESERRTKPFGEWNIVDESD